METPSIYFLPPINAITATASAGRRSASPPRPSLPDDILHEIASYLSFQDSLSLSLVSKHIHTVVPPRITTVICRYEEHIILLCAYVFHPRGGAAVGIERASRLRSLTLADCAYSTRKPSKQASKDLDIDDALIRMFIQVAYAAKNLEYLRINEFYACYSAGAFEVETGEKFPSLVHLHLNDPTDDLLENVSFYSPTLRVLHLSRFWDTPVSAFSLFFDIRQQVRALETLILEEFTFKDLYSEEIVQEWEWTANEPLATIRELILIEVELYTTISHLARSFPNLRSLCIVKHGFPENNSEADGDGAAPAPKVHALTVVDPTPESGLFVPWTCDRLFYVCTEPAEVLDLGVCNAGELVGLTFRVFEMSTDVWDAVVEKLPSISWLELEVLGMDFASTLEYLIRFVSSSTFGQIKCLSILAPRSDFYGHTGADVIKEFLGEVAMGLPSLRYVALAERDEVSANWKEDYSGEHAPWRWWEVRRDGVKYPVKIKVLEIPSWQGERIRKYLRDADAEAMDEFDERFAADRAWTS